MSTTLNISFLAQRITYYVFIFFIFLLTSYLIYNYASLFISYIAASFDFIVIDEVIQCQLLWAFYLLLTKSLLHVFLLLLFCNICLHYSWWTGQPMLSSLLMVRWFAFSLAFLAWQRTWFSFFSLLAWAQHVPSETKSKEDVVNGWLTQ